jgi:chromosome segregation ATPase
MWIVALAVMLALVPATQAAEKKDKTAKRMAQMMQKLQQAQQEKAELQTQFEQEKAALKEKVKKSDQETSSIKGNLAVASRKAKMLTTELETVRKEKSDLEARQSQSEASLQKTQFALESTRKNLTGMTQQYQVAQHDIKEGDAQRKELLANLASKGKQVIACQEKNAKLHEFGLQLVKIYDKPGTYEAILRTEPFSQIKRVELENILQDYRDKLDEQRIQTDTK